MFEIIDSPNFGLNFDPSHFVWMQMDYVKPIYAFKDKIFHIHLKDTRIDYDRLNDVGIMGYPLEYMVAKIPVTAKWIGAGLSQPFPKLASLAVPAWRLRTGRLKSARKGSSRACS